VSATELRDRRGDVGVADPYDRAAVEAGRQAAWAEAGAHATPAADERRSTFVFAGCPVAAGAASLDHVRGYAIADAYARFRRSGGDAVLFSLGFDCFDPLAEQEAARRGVAPGEWVEECCAKIRSQFERLGYSLDWSRAFLSSEPDRCEWSQRLFLALLEKDRVYRRGGRWFLRTGACAEENERCLDALTGWSEDAIGTQLEVLGRVEGVEVDAVVLGGGKLPVFTPHRDSIESAAFIAVSPAHPEIDAFAAQPEVAARLQRAREADWWRAENRAGGAAVVSTGLQASVPGASTLLPIVISPQVDDRFGGTAVLGIPECDEGDRAIAEGLEKPAAGAWKLTKVSSKPRSAVRYRVQDAAITGPRSWGAPVPVVHCEACGIVPLPLEQLPLGLRGDLEGFPECACPQCGGGARRDGDTIDSRFDRMWMWLPLCVPREERATSMLAPAAHQRWLPIGQSVCEADGSSLLDQRALAKMLQDIDVLPPLEAREPCARVGVYGAVRSDDAGACTDLGSAADPDELIEQVGADVVRLALLTAAAPGRAFGWNDEPVRHCQRFIARLWAYADPRLREWDAPPGGEIDGSSKWRRRLAKWCRVAADKVATGIERLEMQRATHNAMLLLTRIEDFESRVAAEGAGELTEADREAVVVALLVLLQLLAPFVPHVAEELWVVAGCETPLTGTSWPE
jgi:leucyl-tRNA synthetase